LNFFVGGDSGVGTNALIIDTNAGIYVPSATGGNKGPGTLNVHTGIFVDGVAVSGVTTGSFTGTLTGVTAVITGTVTWTLAGNAVTLMFPGGFTGASNTTSFTMTGLPVAIQPTHNQQAFVVLDDNSVVATMCLAQLTSGSGTVTFSKATALNAYSTTGFTAAGAKGFSQATAIVYSLA